MKHISPLSHRLFWTSFATAASLVAASLVAPVAVATTLTVDLSSSIGPATHAASGSLYGVTEKLPADVNGLIAPLRPKMFTNPAADIQQPVGDAILVAARIASTTGKVTIRLADWFPGWPYKFANMTDWFDKLSQTTTRKKAATAQNFYGYEIWNEPDGTWTNSMAFTEFWKQSYAKLRDLDPDGKIIGPSISYFNSSYLNNFLSFAKANNCVPDIISWHELGGGNLVGNVQSYRALEKKLGIDPLPISLNEYSGKDRIDDEGQPGASAPIIAKIERSQVDTACISYWDVAHAGRLGSLLATDTSPNGGWWFYKWYGDMTGTMVATTPAAPNDVSTLDGFANLDTTTGKASVLFGGVNDGTAQIVIKGFQAVSIFGSNVHVVVEHTPFVNRMTAVSATNTVSTADLSISNDQISVSVPSTNATDGYRVVLTPVGGTIGAGGAGGSAGATGAGGTGGRGTGGATADGGLGSGGRGGSGGAGGSREDAGNAANGGAAGLGSGGAATGGQTGGPSGGVVAAGGDRTNAGGSSGNSGGDTGKGCSCRMGDPSPTHRWTFVATILALVLWRRRRS